MEANSLQSHAFMGPLELTWHWPLSGGAFVSVWEYRRTQCTQVLETSQLYEFCPCSRLHSLSGMSAIMSARMLIWYREHAFAGWQHVVLPNCQVGYRPPHKPAIEGRWRFPQRLFRWSWELQNLWRTSCWNAPKALHRHAAWYRWMQKA